MIAIINYGMGNLGSIANMIKKVGGESVTTAEKEVIERADRIILPGVGAFDHGMSRLADLGLIDVIKDQAIRVKKPLLGICLGMQLMTRDSEEGRLPGLGLVNAVTRRFSFDDHRLKVPHMGWNLLEIKKASLLFEYPQSEEQRFYFVHSYHVQCMDESDILATTGYGIDFVSAFQRDNIYGVQFHPEKSHRFGMQLFRRFVGGLPC